MYRFLVVFIILEICISVSSQSIDSIQIEKPSKIPIWTICIPGASYYYQKKYLQGSLFAAIEISGLYLGYKYGKDLKFNNLSPYYNFPKAIGIQSFYVEKLVNFKSHLEQFKYIHPDFKYHNISNKDLYLAPFKKENIVTPITGVMILLAGATLGSSYFIEEKKIENVDQMYFVNRYVDRDKALAMYCTIGFAQGWGAGIVEEYQYRNWLMPLLDYKFGQKRGLVYSSLIFGASHLQNYIFDKNPNYKLAMLQVASTSIGGLIYGWDVQNRNYNIGPAVAAHMWFDSILMVGSFLINPKTNYLGINLKYDL